MEWLIPVGILFVLVAIVWVGLSKHPLANTIRARVRGGSAQAANVLDDVSARVDSAELTLEGEIAKSNADLIAIKTNRKGAEREYNDALAQVNQHATQAENAASIGREDLVKEALRLKHEAQAVVDATKGPYETIVADEQRVSNAVALLQKRLSQVKIEKKTLKSEARAADVTTRVDSIVAGIDTNGYQRDLEKARELLNQKKDKAGAMREMAQQVEARDKLAQELKALGTEQTNLDAEAAAMMAKYAKTSNNTEKAPGA